MKNICYILTFLFSSTSFFSQEKVFELDGAFSSNKYSQKDSYAIPNQLTGELMLLMEEKEIFNANLLDSEYKIKDKIVAKVLPSKYQYILGYNVTDKNYSLFFSNTKSTKFGVQIFDFKNNTSKPIELDFKLKKEKYVESINYKNKIHLITITKNSSDLNIYTFDEEFNPQKEVISLKRLELTNHNSKLISTYKVLLNTKDPLSTFIDITKIETQNPNVIETTSKENKLYQFDNQIVFSFDYNYRETKLCNINLDTFEPIFKTYNKPGKSEEGYKKSNSYIFDNKLFQIASSSQKMKFSILDLNTEKVIKEYAITKEDSITFKNSPILQEGGGMFPAFTQNRVREMEKTAKYLRKISSADLGISVYKTGKVYNVILGGTKETQSGGTFTPSFGPSFGISGTMGDFSTAWVSFNPTFYGYSNYSNTKSTYINCRFDKNFEHLKGTIQKNIYDMVDYFEETLDDPLAINIFLHQNKIHYGYYDIDDSQYKLFKFK
ncbi:hypothetical protein [Aquimarina sp. MMG016]|uniref:hypothetical protein n=1 Tax=Aquimarina sp. MMG016 TaxID=2822690 RepID=UPI001B39D0BE|nr:hypothetical protein [Aquimarina sp. MMG016]MBQ4818964.1 hypothetical protein [Aquimarina sp. MMG016]